MAKPASNAFYVAVALLGSVVVAYGIFGLVGDDFVRYVNARTYLAIGGFFLLIPTLKFLSSQHR